MYRCQHFDVRELVPEETYRVMGYKAWWLLDTRLLITLDALRERFGPVIVNTWWSLRLVDAYGHRNQSGFRTRGHYSSMVKFLRSHSQHKYGRAVDCLFADVSVGGVREFIVANPDVFPLITAVEKDVPWLHIDVRNCEPVMTF
jgi:hypothetical protein